MTDVNLVCPQCGRESKQPESLVKTGSVWCSNIMHARGEQVQMKPKRAKRDTSR